MKNIPPPLLFWPRDTSLTSKGKEETLNKLNCSKKESLLQLKMSKIKVKETVVGA